MSDGIDFGSQVINAATGQQVDNVLLIMASAGLVLDATTGGVGDVTAIFKAIYKESRRIGGIFADVIAAEVGQLLSGKTAGQVIDALKVRFKVVVDFGAEGSGCGALGIGCFKQYDGIATKVKSREGVSNSAALDKLDSQYLKDSRYEQLDLNDKERLDDLSASGLECPIPTAQGLVSAQAALLCPRIVTLDLNKRVTRVTATLDSSFIGTDTTAAARRWVKGRTNPFVQGAGLPTDETGHILARVLGGPGGLFSNNIVPLSRAANDRMQVIGVKGTVRI